MYDFLPNKWRTNSRSSKQVTLVSGRREGVDHDDDDKGVEEEESA